MVISVTNRVKEIAYLPDHADAVHLCEEPERPSRTTPQDTAMMLQPDIPDFRQVRT